MFSGFSCKCTQAWSNTASGLRDTAPWLLLAWLQQNNFFGWWLERQIPAASIAAAADTFVDCWRNEDRDSWFALDSTLMPLMAISFLLSKSLFYDSSPVESCIVNSLMSHDSSLGLGPCQGHLLLSSECTLHLLSMLCSLHFSVFLFT